MSKKQRTTIFLFLHFLIFVVYNLGHPVTHAFLASIKGPDYLQGTLLAVMALGGFMAAPIWGQLGDKYGYRIMGFAPLGYAIGQLGFVFFSNPVYLVGFRFIAGLFSSASIVLHFIYLSNLSETKEIRTQTLGIAALLGTASAGLGYILGGIIGNQNPRLTFAVQIIFSLMLSVTLFIFIEGQPKKATQIHFDFITQNIRLMRKYAKNGLVYIVLLTFINVVANNVMILSQILPSLGKIYELNPQTTGMLFATGTTSATLVSYIFVRKYLPKITNHTKMLPFLSGASAILGIVSIPLIYITNQLGFIIFILLFIGITFFNTLFVTIVQELLSHLSEKEEHGKITGVNQSFQSLAVFAGSFGASFLFAYKPFFPIYLGVILFVIVTVYNIVLISFKRI